MAWNSLIQKLGHYIYRRRKHLNLTQEQVAIEAYVDIAHLRSIERGRTNVSLRILRKIIRVLKIGVYTFFILLEKGTSF